MGRVEGGVGAYDAYMAVYIGVGLSPPAFPLPRTSCSKDRMYGEGITNEVKFCGYY